MEPSLPHTLHLFNIFRENDGKENCPQLLEEECIKMFGTRSLYDEHDCNVVRMNSLNIHDAREAKFDEDGIFCPPSFDEKSYYDESMPHIYDDYCDDMYSIKNNDNHETCRLDFIFQLLMPHMIVILFSLLPLLLMRISLLTKRVAKFLCL